ncbi:hypothetical protein WK24_16195 [Burkholderia vietnamiensis]|nr:hypothetical protein WJ05_09320 [Burkholderia vietnamiensis]KVR66560.1 hypothetical protein WK24_16195 [Burkholderia vietnamiensis]KVR93559.1 hypothetical protein WK28_14970 [Burkholderia vietnamiensis]
MQRAQRRQRVNDSKMKQRGLSARATDDDRTVVAIAGGGRRGSPVPTRYRRSAYNPAIVAAEA